MQLLRAIASLMGCAVFATALAQDYPSRPVRLVVPFPAGGGTDILSRAIGQQLTDQWRQPVVVDNRPGAGANIGAENAARSPADGYTLFMAATIHSINPSLFPRLPYDILTDFTPITLVAETAQVLVVHPSVPAANLAEFIVLLKSRPGQLSYSSTGNGSQPHLAAELFKTMTGTNMLHVPYRGAAPAINDLLAGHVAVSFATSPSAVPAVRSGKLKAFGVSSTQRIPSLPDVPTIGEAGVPGYEASGFLGLMAPAGLPARLVERINAAVVGVVKDPAMRATLSDLGYEVLASTPAEYATFLRAEVAKWATVVKESGAKID